MGSRKDLRDSSGPSAEFQLFTEASLDIVSVEGWLSGSHFLRKRKLKGKGDVVMNPDIQFLVQIIVSMCREGQEKDKTVYIAICEMQWSLCPGRISASSVGDFDL